MKSSETIIASASRTFSFRSPGYAVGSTIRVTAEAYHIGGNAHPHFSVTAEIKEPRCRDVSACGCLHDETLKVWPAIRPLVDLHLSNADNGEPTHAEENGFYWLEGALGGLGSRYHGGSGSGGRTQEQCLQIFADHIRRSREDAASIIRNIKAVYDASRDTVATSAEVSPRCDEECQRVQLAAAKAEWKAVCDAMRPRWEREAEAGLALLRSLEGKS